MRKNLMKTLSDNELFISAGHQNFGDSSVSENVCGLWAFIFCHGCSLKNKNLLLVSVTINFSITIALIRASGIEIPPQTQTSYTPPPNLFKNIHLMKFLKKSILSPF